MFGLVPSSKKAMTLWVGSVAGVEQVPDHLAVLAVERYASSLTDPLGPVPLRAAAPSSARTVGATSTSRQCRSTMPSCRTPAPEIDERGTRLDHIERTVLPAVVLTTVRGGVDHAEIGRTGMVEDLCDVLVGVRVAVDRRCRDSAWRAPPRGARSEPCPGSPEDCVRSRNHGRETHARAVLAWRRNRTYPSTERAS